MLKSLQLKNFKSFLDSQKVEIKPINLLAGANSSGKSSLIQSLLLIKQTIQYGAENRPLAFNGPIQRLGTVNDVRNSRSKDGYFEISFEIAVEPTQEYGAPSWLRRYSSVARENAGELKSFVVTIRIGAESTEDSWRDTHSRLGAQLMRTSIDYAVEYKEQMSRVLKFEIVPDEGSQLGRVVVDAAEIEALEGAYPSASISRGYIEKFMPTFVWINYNGSPREASSLTDYIIGRSLFDQSHAREDDVISGSVVSAINSWCESAGRPIEEPIDGKTYSQLKPLVQRVLPVDFGLRLPGHSSRSEKMRASLRDMLRDAIIQDLPVDTRQEGTYVENIHVIKRVVETYFKEGVRYLGPLREPPRPVYQPEALESFTEVGYRGEHTASVIEINKRTYVDYIEPPDSAVNAELRTESHSSLEVALTSWLKYLGVAKQVQTTDAGVYGNRLQVSMEDYGPLHDLTNVGVGVSQVLPILVSTLLAPRGSLLIFEQPELHLHPKVQSRLADFLIGAARLGKQMILETHSEYMIDRLRLRIAQDAGGETSSLINIMFLEQSEGVTSIQPIEVTEYGVIKNWPSDFFDQAEKDSNAIIDAARRKRQRRKEERLP